MEFRWHRERLNEKVTDDLKVREPDTGNGRWAFAFGLCLRDWVGCRKGIRNVPNGGAQGGTRGGLTQTPRTVGTLPITCSAAKKLQTEPKRLVYPSTFRTLADSIDRDSWLFCEEIEGKK
jgi:hypothetical protein